MSFRTPAPYVMSAEENYDPAMVSQWNAATQPTWIFQDKQYIGTSFDHNRRKIMYSGIIANNSPSGGGEVPNTTGFTLWSGSKTIAPGANVDVYTEFNFFIYEKDVDTGNVVVYNANPLTVTVPAGVAATSISGTGNYNGHGTAANATYTMTRLVGGTGTGALADVYTNAATQVNAVLMRQVGRGYTVGDVLNFSHVSGDLVGHCTVTSIGPGSDGTWRRFVYDTSNYGGDVEGFVNPYTEDYWVHCQSCELYLFRNADRYAQMISPYLMTLNPEAFGNPVGVTADWVYFLEYFSGDNIMHILPSTITSAEVAMDQLLSTYDYPYPDNTYIIRNVIGPDGNLYAYGGVQTGARNYKLWQCVPGAGFTEITPWTSSTGPNSNCAAWFQMVWNPAWATNYIIKLPGDPALVLIQKQYPSDAGHPNNFDYFRVDFTYYNIVTGAFSYWEGVVTGYMDVHWRPTSSDAAFWNVLNFQEINNYLECSDYNYPDVDYALRWFNFICEQVNGSGNQMSVFVQYRFDSYSGGPPQVVQVVPETGWDNAYPAYGATIGQPEVVAGSLPTLSVSQNYAYYTDFFFEDNAVYDPATGFWLSGDNPFFCDFDPRFAGRYSQVYQAWNGTESTAVGPFMRLIPGAGISPGPPDSGRRKTQVRVIMHELDIKG